MRLARNLLVTLVVLGLAVAIALVVAAWNDAGHVPTVTEITATAQQWLLTVREWSMQAVGIALALGFVYWLLDEFVFSDPEDRF